MSKALAETIIWCSRQTLETTSDDPEFLWDERLLEQRRFKETNFRLLSPLSAQLRDAALRPSIDIGEVSDEVERQDAIASVIERRSHLLTEPFDQEQILSTREGRILIYEPSENVADGASQAGSLGFFGANDDPPWDTWIHYESGKLACWVPADLLTFAQNGLDANPVQCIYWADR